MKRRLFNVLAAVSLVLCVATVVLWVRSEWKQDHVVFFRDSSLDPAAREEWFRIISANGGAGLSITPAHLGLWNVAEVRGQRVVVRSGDAHEAYPASGVLGYRPWHGFIILRDDLGWQGTPPALWRFLTVPYWAIAILSSIQT